jgi:hypothetical protein
MTAFLDELGVSVRLVEGGRASAVTHGAARGPPDVQFGCNTEFTVFGDECSETEEAALGRGGQRMRLAVARPLPEWTTWIGQVMSDWGVDYTLVVFLEVGVYPLLQEGTRGTKVVQLGTAHRQVVPWLTSLESPVRVLQLTGALVQTDGRAIRIGAEGLLARRTPLLVSVFDEGALVTEDEIAALRASRRTELPGAPLAWKVGLEELVAQLTGREAPNQR